MRYLLLGKLFKAVGIQQVLHDRPRTCTVICIEILDRRFQFGAFLVGALLCCNGEHFIVCGRIFLNSFDAEQLAACLLSYDLGKEVSVGWEIKRFSAARLKFCVRASSAA